MKTLKNILLAGTLASLGLITSCSGETAFSSKRTMGYNAGVVKSAQVPLKLRDIPSHPHDDYVPISNVAPISDKEVGRFGKEFLPVDFEILGGVSINDSISIKAGIGCEIDWLTEIINGSYGEVHERDYAENPGSEERGEHSALTYYRICNTYMADWNKMVKPYISAEVQFSSDSITLGMGYKIDWEHVIAENGWDRFNEYERWKQYDVANLVVGTPYVSLNWPFDKLKEGSYATIDLGFPEVIQKSVTGFGKEMDLEFGNAWSIGLGVTTTF